MYLEIWLYKKIVLAFVTKSVFGQLVVKIDTKNDIGFIDQKFFSENIYPKGELQRFFYQPELKRLYNYRFLLENQKDGLSYFTFNEDKEDDFNLVYYRGGHLKYHLYDNCEALNRDFVDFHVVSEVKEKGEDFVNIYRGWFKTMKFKEDYLSGDISNEDIVELYNTVFAKTHNLKRINKDYVLAEEVPYSGRNQVSKSFDLGLFENKLNEIIADRMMLCQGDTKRLLAKVDYMRNSTDLEIQEKFKELNAEFPKVIGEEFLKNFGINNIRNYWNNHYRLKSRVKKMLCEYFRWTYGFDKLDFNIIHLENFGLRCCKFCETKSKLITP